MANQITKELSVTVETTIFQRRERIITIKIKAPRDYFSAGEFLSQYGKFKTIEGFFESLVRDGSDAYLSDAREAIARIEPKVA